MDHQNFLSGCARSFGGHLSRICAGRRLLGIDELLGPDYLNVGPSHLGRTSPVTSLGLVGACVALLVTLSRGLARFASAIVAILASMLIAVGTVSVLGDVVGRQAYGWNGITRMSLQSSAAFALLGEGLMAWAWRENRREKNRPPDWLPLTLGVGLGAGALGIWQALLAHQPGELPMISGIVLALGLLGSLLVAITVAQTQQARKRSRELQGSNVLLQQIFDASPDGLLMANRRGTIIRVNEQAERIFGYTHDELIGQSVERLVPEKFHDLHSSHWEGYHATPGARSMGLGLELSYKRKDGSEFPAEITLSPVQSRNEMQVLVVVRDISERKRNEEILRQSEERFRSVFEQGPLGVSLMGMDRRMLSVNSAFCRMLGYSKEELTSLSPLEITYPDDKDLSADLMERLFHRDFPARHNRKAVREEEWRNHVGKTHRLSGSRPERPAFVQCGPDRRHNRPQASRRRVAAGQRDLRQHGRGSMPGPDGRWGHCSCQSQIRRRCSAMVRMNLQEQMLAAIQL